MVSTSTFSSETFSSSHFVGLEGADFDGADFNGADLKLDRFEDDEFEDRAFESDVFEDMVNLDGRIKLTTYSWTGFERLGVAIFTRSLFYNDISIRFRLSHGYGTISQFSPIF